MPANDDATIWDDVYIRETDWGAPFPSDFLWKCLEAIPEGGKVLDLGSGTGRNAIPLSKLGYEVTAVDISQIAVRRLETIAIAQGLAMKTERTDVLNLILPEKFDLVLAHGLLNSLRPHAWAQVIDKIKAWTKHGGIAVLSYFNSYSGRNSVDGREVLMLAEPNYGLDAFAEWSVIQHDSRCETHSHGVRATHQHVTERLIIRNEPDECRSPKQPTVIAVVGPTNILKAETTGPISEGLLIAASNTVGETLAAAGKQLLCIPDEGVGRAVFMAYAERRPAHLPHVLVPDDDPTLGSRSHAEWLNSLGAPASIDRNVTWQNQARVLVERADAVVALGLSVGSVQEILWTKWIPRPVFMSLDTSNRLPVELRRDLTIFEFPRIGALVDYLSQTWGRGIVTPA